MRAREAVAEQQHCHGHGLHAQALAFVDPLPLWRSHLPLKQRRRSLHRGRFHENAGPAAPRPLIRAAGVRLHAASLAGPQAYALADPGW